MSKKHDKKPHKNTAAKKIPSPPTPELEHFLDKISDTNVMPDGMLFEVDQTDLMKTHVAEESIEKPQRIQ